MRAMLGINASRPGRALPAWLTAPTFVAASLATLAMLGHAAGGAQHGIAGVHLYWIAYLYWIGAVPAVILLGLLVLPPERPKR
jgi:solute:Na+ symporter, SSS family